VTLEYLNQLLLEYPNDSLRTASDVVSGFQDAIDELEDITMDDMDEAFTELHHSIMTMPTFHGIQSRLAAITLSTFFVEKFKYLPAPAIPLIEMRDTSNSIPSPLPQNRTSPIDSNDISQASTVPTTNTQVRSQQSHVPSNNLSAPASFSRIPSRKSLNEGRVELTRDVSRVNLAAVGIQNQPTVDSKIIQSSDLGEAEII
jgi:hypothetical protein